MSNKKINYLARDFQGIKSELIKFSKEYYPELTDSYNDASVGSWIIDLVSAVGDNLSYHTDRMYQENNVDSANLKSSVINAAKINGIKIPGPKASMCEIELSCSLPINSNGNISFPSWDDAPIIKMGSVVGNSSYHFELIEDVNFGEQFNMDGVSNRKYTPNRNSNGVITGYTVTKTTLVMGGSNKVYKKVLSQGEVEPFMEVVLPEKNVMNIESIIFKEGSNFNAEPRTYEYYIDEEEFRFGKEEISTYRFFEVNSLSDQWRFGTKTKFVENTDGMVVPYDNKIYQDYTEGTGTTSSQRTTRYFQGQWKPITQKFITEYTDNGYLKIIFGSGTQPLNLDTTNETNTVFAEHMLTKIMNNDLLGVLPKVGWTMFVLYRTGGGTSSNLAQGAINTIINANTVFESNANDSVKSQVVQSLKVKNISPSVGGKDMPSVEEIKFLTKYAIPSQDRCITVKDYKTKILQIHPRYGCPFRLNAIEDNNKVVISCLGLNSQGKLDNGLPELMKDNIVEYLKEYKTLGDYVELTSGKIYNIGFGIDVFIDKNYTTSDVVKSIINKVKDYMSVQNHDMGEDIFIGDLEKEINLLDGVLSLIDLRVYAIHGGNHSADICPLPTYVDYTTNCEGVAENNSFVTTNGASSFRISLEEIDHLLYSDYNSMYEILDADNDIQIKCKLK